MSLSPARFLAELAEPLEPTRAPYYLTASNNGAPDGWYCQFNGSEKPKYLGRNVVWAEKRLLELVRKDAA